MVNTDIKEVTKSWLAPFPRKFVDSGLAISGWEDIEPYYEKLVSAPVESPEALYQWLSNWSELKRASDEFVTRRYIAMTCDTNSADKKEAFLYCVREIDPNTDKWDDKLNRRYIELSAQFPPKDAERANAHKKISVEIELFDEKNVPLDVRLSELSQQYQELIGGLTVMFEGKERTLPQMGAFLKEQDRALRERALFASVKRRLQEKEKLETIFDEMAAVRSDVALNLGLKDYREFCFKNKHRDYTPEDCLEFHDSIEKTALPLLKQIHERRRKQLGLDALYPWDLACDPLGLPPLKPFTSVNELSEGVKSVFYSVDTRLGEMFESILFSMDLDSRVGKAPGGYQANLEEARIPFIFTNAVGTPDDVNTLLHEGGHAFNTLVGRNQNLYWNREPCMEFAEVASMTMELIGGESLSPFYANVEDIKRAKRERLESIVGIFPWVAEVDAFQHWIYTHPGHTRDERKEAWLSISKRFTVVVDWSKTPAETLDYQWHKQLHIFELPFYYIEYAIAQIGALQIYKRYKKEPVAALEGYLNALKLGGSVPARELFKAAGVKFDFSAGLLGELMDFVRQELEL